jgi:hypothetical protein
MAASGCEMSRSRLDLPGTVRSLTERHVALKEGMALFVCDEDGLDDLIDGLDE